MGMYFSTSIFIIYCSLTKACGADAVVFSESEEFVERMKEGQKCMTTSCCPGFVNYIENQFKDLAEN
ncbi:hypothetical protein FC745_04540, partial [Clostridium botulinum]|nr:hypothetical protein [Clostridium botulinum]